MRRMTPSARPPGRRTLRSKEAPTANRVRFTWTRAAPRSAERLKTAASQTPVTDGKLVLERGIAAPPEKRFRAWTEPDRIK